MSQHVSRKEVAEFAEVPVPSYSRESPVRRRPGPALGSWAACDLATRLSAAHYEVLPADLLAAARGCRRISRARHVAIYLAHVTLGLPLASVALQFGRDRTTAAYACRLVEDMRERPDFDVTVATLEIAAKALTGWEEA
jgi:hypothetical protein